MLFTGGEPDEGDTEHVSLRPDSIVFEGLAGDFPQDIEKLARNGRILAPLSDPLLEGLKASCGGKILTFDLDDPDANFFAQNIRKGPSGYSFEMVYRPSSDMGSRLVNRFIPGYDKNLFAGVSIGSTDINDVLNSVIAFGCASLMGAEPQHVRNALIRYTFASRPKEVKKDITEKDILSMREFEED